MKFYNCEAKGLKLKVRKFLGLSPTFVEVTGEKLVGGLFAPPPPPSWIGLITLGEDTSTVELSTGIWWAEYESDFNWLQITAWRVSKYGGFFWSVFSCTRTKYGDLQSKSPYSVRIQENSDQKKLRSWTLFTQWMSMRLHVTASNYGLE